ncbi:glycosyltransferase family 4 protein, partial [bacterium]|nr:glycosyltransferase family 4 protein [bacterium]
VYYIGNLYDSYKPETLIEAMRALGGHELFIVGGNDPGDLARAREHAGRAGVAARVHFLGYVPPPQVAEHYRRCRAVVTLLAGQKIAEYLSCGLPMVAPDLPTVRETLRDGETALLFKLGDTQSLAHALRRILDDPALALRLARSAHAEAARHSWPIRAERIVQFISHCMSSEAQPPEPIRPQAPMAPVEPAPTPRRRARRSCRGARRLRGIHYVSRISLPNDHAHSIQMMRTCHALAHNGVEVDFYVRGSEPGSVPRVLEHYGLDPVENFRIHWVAAKHWEGAHFLARLVPRLFRQGPDATIYTRDYHLARRFIRLRPILRMPVVVETHKRSGYFEMGYKTDGELAVGPEALDQDRRTESQELVDYSYCHANGVVCVYIDTFSLVAERHPTTPVLRAWYDIAPADKLDYDPSTRDGICYVGNLYERYRPAVLVEALSLVPGQRLHTIGGNEEAHLNNLRRLAEQYGVADRCVLEGYVPPSQVQSLFRRFRVAVALLPGLKIAEYFSQGIPIVAPDMPVARDLLRDGETCLLFEPGSAGSLAGAISRILGDPELAHRLAAGALEEAHRHAHPDRATRLTRFIEGLL